MIVLAVFVNWQLSRFSLFLFQTINLTSLVIIYYAQRKGEIFGASLGALGGLLTFTRFNFNRNIWEFWDSQNHRWLCSWIYCPED